MKNILDYTFYRTAKRHFKRDGIDAFTAKLTITFILSLYCIPFIIYIIDLFKLKPNLNIEIILYIFINFIIYFLVKIRYKNKYLILRDKWINEKKSEKYLGEIYIILFFFSPLLLMFIVKWMF